MKNTDYTPIDLSSMISSEDSLNTLLDMMGEMGLELDSACKLQETSGDHLAGSGFWAYTSTVTRIAAILQIVLFIE